jgi:hypothetical protein
MRQFIVRLHDALQDGPSSPPHMLQFTIFFLYENLPKIQRSM